jgi:hypothetical protein
MRLAKLRVKGYRSIKKDESLVTDERITILIGANDHGKSNLLAAIRCLNDEDLITIEDRNWDLLPTDPVEIVWHFRADRGTLDVLEKFAPNDVSVSLNDLDLLLAKTQVKVSEAAGTDVLPSAPPAAASSVTPVAEPSVPSQPILVASATEAGSVASTAAPAATPEPLPASPAVTAPIPRPNAVSHPESTDPISEAQEQIFPVNQEGEIVFARDLSTNKVRVISMPLPVVVS